MAGGGYFVPSDLSDAIARYMAVFAKRLDARILYGEDAPDFCGIPHTERELANNIAMCRLAQDLSMPEGIFLKEQVANIFRVPKHLLGYWKPTKGATRGKSKVKASNARRTAR